MFLVVGVEIYCKIRGAFVTEKTVITNVDNIQAIHSRLGLFFQVIKPLPTLSFRSPANVGQYINVTIQWGLTLLLIIFIICDVAGIPTLVPNIMFRSAYEVRLYFSHTYSINAP